MKINEYFKMLDNFEKMFDDKRLTLDGKITIGKEFIHALPPVQMVRSTINTRNFCMEYFVNTINGAVDAKENQSKMEADSGSKVDNKKSTQTPKQNSKGKRRS